MADDHITNSGAVVALRARSPVRPNPEAERFLDACGTPLRLSTHRANAAWRACARDLDEATAALASANAREYPTATWVWMKAAMQALDTPTGRINDLRSRAGLVAILAGCRNPIGSAMASVEGEFNPLEKAFAMLDWEIARSIRREEEGLSDAHFAAAAAAERVANDNEAA